jgi:hypothetical protein
LKRYGVHKRGPELVEWLLRDYGGTYTSTEPYGVAIHVAEHWNRIYPGSDHNRQGATNTLGELEKAGYIEIDRNPQSSPVRISVPERLRNGHHPERMRLGEVIEKAGAAKPRQEDKPIWTTAPPAPPKPGTTNAELDTRLVKAFDAIHSIERDIEASDNIAVEMGEHIVAINTRIHALVEWARAISKNLGAEPPHLRDSEPASEYQRPKV